MPRLHHALCLQLKCWHAQAVGPGRLESLDDPTRRRSPLGFRLLEIDLSQATRLQGYRDTALQGHGVTRLQVYKTTRPQGYNTTGLQHYKATRLQGYKVTGLQDCKTTWLHGYRATGLQGYRATRLQRRQMLWFAQANVDHTDYGRAMFMQTPGALVPRKDTFTSAQLNTMYS